MLTANRTSRTVGERALGVLGRNLESFQMSEDLDLIWLDEPLENQLFLQHPWLYPYKMETTKPQLVPNVVRKKN